MRWPIFGYKTRKKSKNENSVLFRTYDRFRFRPYERECQNMQHFFFFSLGNSFLLQVKVKHTILWPYYLFTYNNFKVLALNLLIKQQQKMIKIKTKISETSWKTPYFSVLRFRSRPYTIVDLQGVLHYTIICNVFLCIKGNLTVRICTHMVWLLICNKTIFVSNTKALLKLFMFFYHHK